MATSASRQAMVQQLQEEAFDVLVIGGGINGAGIARDAAMRGFRVALVEKGDFGSGTSSKSSKLIHGGVRYLQQGDFRLVRVALRERDLLRRRLAPHLVQPLPFLFPVYRGDPVGVFTLGVGMWLYDLLAIFRNIRSHRMLSAKRVSSLEPCLRSAGLRGAALYYDCWTDDARLTLETILAARDEGAVVANYVGVRGFTKQNGRAIGALLEDGLSGQSFEVRARSVVNATGPWADHVRRLDEPSAKPCLRLTKGVHVIVPRERLGNVHAVVLHSPRDQRILFVIPWGSLALIGTTDTDFEGCPDDVVPDRADWEYLLEAANWFFPRAGLRAPDVVNSYAGLRPLVKGDDDEDPSAVSREEAIFESKSGVITLAGGKLTTYRLVAEEVVNRIALAQGGAKRRAPCRTATKALRGGSTESTEDIVGQLIARNGGGFSVEQIRHLVQRYGSRASEVIALAQSNGDLTELMVPPLPDIWAEVDYAACEEMAVSADDILLRRTSVGIRDPADAAQVAQIVAKKLENLKRQSG